MFLVRNEHRIALLFIVLALFSRALLLEITDLIDPTEARYASVAQEMVTSDDWVTPKLPMPEGVVPYLGKPPLHFWLTALAYKAFWVDEWTSRLPSLFAAIAMLAVVYLFSRRYFDRTTADIAVVVTLSSAMFFFLAGASVTDVTLSALLCAAVWCLYRCVSDAQAQPLWAYSATVLCALAFLCKGPVALVLCGLPIIIWSAYTRDFSWLARIPKAKAALLFALIVAPWFVLSEIRHPGFLRYFVWNENIARYLFKEYGDRYGSGHVHPRGTSWVMLALARMPWTLVLAWGLFKSGLRGTWSWLTIKKERAFVLVWGISCALFFTFVRQLHAMYLLPGVPALSILVAEILKSHSETFSDASASRARRRLWAGAAAVVLCAGLVIAGVVLGMQLWSCVICVAMLFVTWCSARMLLMARSPTSATTAIAGLLIAVYVTAIIAATPKINQNRSAENILTEVAEMMPPELKVGKVGVMTRNSYSHYWVAKAWKTELGRELQVEYVAKTSFPTSDVHYLLIKGDSAVEDVPQEALPYYSVLKQSGEWILLVRKSTRAAAYAAALGHRENA